MQCDVLKLTVHSNARQNKMIIKMIWIENSIRLDGILTLNELILQVRRKQCTYNIIFSSC